MSAAVSTPDRDGSHSRPLRAKPLALTQRHGQRTAQLEGKIRQVRLVVDEDDELDTSTLEAEFPTLVFDRVERVAQHQTEPNEVVIDDFAWRGAFDFCRFDELMDQTRAQASISVRGVDAVGVAMEVLARYQRLLVRRNEASSTALFASVLQAHAGLFEADLSADLEHALDTWQWMLRLEPNVGLVPQLAALFHDIERLGYEPHERLEHRAHRAIDRDSAPESRRGNDAVKAVKSEPTGERLDALLRELGIDEADAARVRDLVLGRSAGAHDSALLDDADALSFLSLMSPRYADHFGLAQTRRKVTFTVSRLGPVARARVPLFRLRPDVDRLLQG